MFRMRDAEDLRSLLGRAAGGDAAAFEVLYDALSARVHGMVLRVLRDAAQSEEVTQEVFVQVWRDAASFDASRGSVPAWVLTIAHRRAVDRVRSEVAASAREVVYESRSRMTEFDTTAEAAMDRDSAGQVHRAMAVLPAGQRQAIELAYFGGLTHREVSERLSLPLGTAKGRIRDGLTRLRREMGGRP
jgi:RNA polymerase sigma-70 factor (ECF subfamily)